MPAHIDPASMVSWGDLDPPEKLKFSQNANIILTNEISTHLLQNATPHFWFEGLKFRHFQSLLLFVTEK